MSSRIHHLLESVSRKCNRIPRKFEFHTHRTNEVSWKVGTARTRWFVGINIKSPCSLAHVVRRDHVHRARNADYAARVYERFVNFISKMTRLSNIELAFLDKFTMRNIFVGFFFLTVLFGCWLAEQENFDHILRIILEEQRLSFDLIVKWEARDAWRVRESAWRVTRDASHEQKLSSHYLLNRVSQLKGLRMSERSKKQPEHIRTQQWGKS